MTNKEFKEIGSMLSAQATKPSQRRSRRNRHTDPSKEAWEDGNKKRTKRER